MLLLLQYNGFLCYESFRRFNLQSKLAHVLHIRVEKSSTRMYFFSEPDYTIFFCITYIVILTHVMSLIEAVEFFLLSDVQYVELHKDS